MTTLRFILGDQLSDTISSLRDVDKAHDMLFMCEVLEEATYVKHHPKKIALVFSAMRHFAERLKKKGFNVVYIALDDRDNTGTFTGELARVVAAHNVAHVVVTHPGEYRVLQAFKDFNKQSSCELEIRDDDRFICTIERFKTWSKDYKQVRLEYFYRYMRKETGYLMTGDTPEGGAWNYDKENRKPLPKDINVPPRMTFAPDAITRRVLDLVGARFSNHFGSLEGFDFAVTDQQAEQVLKDFIQYRLPHFGDYQDAMKTDEAWLFHSHISFYLNIGLLLPETCITHAINAYQAGKVPLNAVEGFVRQILGWREFVRGVYWTQMPEYKKANFLNAKRPLPDFYWTSETRLNCMKQCIKATAANAYAHHIQRLMVLGNFALLAGLDPDAVNEWYLIVYADAYEWVELPNVTGMILFADGGYFASKPYAAGGAYINKMSDYCKGCDYNVKEKTGDTACPFNYLYWDFLIRHQKQLEGNPRLTMMYKQIDKMDVAHRQAIHDSANTFLEAL